MREPQVIVAFGDVIAEFVGECDPQAEGRAVVADQIDAGEFGFLAAVLREGGRGEGRFGRDEALAVALVEPFGLRADCARGGAAALHAFEEQAHRIGLLPLGGGLVHRVAAGGRAKWVRPVPASISRALSGWSIAGSSSPASSAATRSMLSSDRRARAASSRLTPSAIAACARSGGGDAGEDVRGVLGQDHARVPSGRRC